MSSGQLEWLEPGAVKYVDAMLGGANPEFAFEVAVDAALLRSVTDGVARYVFTAVLRDAIAAARHP